MLDKFKLFKNNERPTPTVTGKRTSSSSGVSSAKSERSDSSASLEPNPDVKVTRNVSNTRVKPQRVGNKNVPGGKNSPSSNKKELINGGVKASAKITADVEKHANKTPATKSNDLKVKVSVSSAKQVDVGGNKISSQGLQSGLPTQHGTGIPKPTAAVKGTSKVQEKSAPAGKLSSGISRDSSQTSIAQQAKVALVSPMKSSDNQQLSESSASTGQHSNSSESSVIYKPSSESGSDNNNVIPNRKEQVSFDVKVFVCDVNCILL